MQTDSNLTRLSPPVSRGSTSGRRARRARAVLERPPAPQGWDTSDAHEIELRRWRGRTEIAAVEALEPEHSVFGAFRVRSESGSAYEVEIRDLDRPLNSCGCIDHRVNGLGTCKHIEGVLAGLRRRGVRAFRQAAVERSLRVEIFLQREGAPVPAIAWPRRADTRFSATRAWLAPWLEADGRLRAGPADIESLLEAHKQVPTAISEHLRVSRHFGAWLERHRRDRSRAVARADFAAEVERDPGCIDILRHPLLPYQREGMIHLAFGERALLADDMGLGKTVQAIAACEFLARRRGIARVLVVCPASLKAEWEEQIGRFADRPAQSVFGPRAARLAAYRAPPFFTIVNYEQVVSDAKAMNELLAPDVVVLDEAQRIKNWHTKTAREVKSLRSPYAFVLTGTPVENRIDELYSIVQYLDPELVGPLFRFNRTFYKLDERGRPVDYRNLDELRRRVQPVLLRRRKSDVETELPGRSVKTFFVPMAEEQKVRYDEYQEAAARIASRAKKRPLTEQEFKRLQMCLACMRMICDTPAILDPTCRVCPKLEELERILEDLLEDPERKIIIFSEWERMLALVRELAGELGTEVAWHTGSVPQARRRQEINRFKQDPSCRLFLSTDSGSVGLNLQAASAVINLDLPWNPAKLEQRIARAWRKNQTRSVTVVNLVTEASIEHSMLNLLGAKQALAEGLIDGLGDVGKLKMPSGRGSLVERMRLLLEKADALGPRIVPAEEVLAADLGTRHGERVLRVEVRSGPGDAMRMLAVLDLEPEALAAEAARLNARDGAAALPVEVVDRSTWLAVSRLVGSGILGLTGGPRRVLRTTPELADVGTNLGESAAPAAGWRREAERAVKMAGVLAAGGFPEEVPALLEKALRHALAARAAAAGDSRADPALADPEEVLRIARSSGLSAEAELFLTVLRRGAAAPAEAADLVASADRLVGILCVSETSAMRQSIPEALVA